MKRKMAYLLVAGMMLSSFSGCGNSESENEQTKTASVFEEKNPEDYSGTIEIWSWTDDPVYQIEAFNKVYPNIKVEFTQIGEDYDVKMQTIVDNETEGPDIFCADAKVVKNYMESDAWENLSEAPYSADDMAQDLVDYTRELGSDEEGNLRALSWQATPGGFWYKRSMAKEYLGTDDPDQISEMLSTTDGILDIAEQIKEKSGGKTAFTTNFQDLWMMACYGERTEPWVKDGKFIMDDYVEEFLDLGKTIREKGYDAKLEAWSTAWYGAAADDSIFGYILPTWGMQYVIQGSAPESKGDWAIASLPVSYFNGGTYMGIYKLSKEKELAWQYLKFITLNADYSGQYAVDKSDFPALKSVIADMTPEWSDPWCGGQNTFEFFDQETEKINSSLVTKYDDTINNLLLQNAELYAQGEMSKEETIEQFKADVASAYQSITVE